MTWYFILMDYVMCKHSYIVVKKNMRSLILGESCSDKIIIQIKIRVHLHVPMLAAYRNGLFIIHETFPLIKRAAYQKTL